MSDDNLTINYRIRLEEDHFSVKATYDLSVPACGSALIADFLISIDGTDLISGFVPGQAAFNCAKFHTLADPNRDAWVSFSMSSNHDCNASDDDLLRGDRVYDDAKFSN
ncbi:MAG: hypothetical protein ACYDCG_18405 [Candidatus Acidiferrales bacterium]